MGTKHTTTGSNTSTLQFNPQSQNLYNQLIGSSGNQLQGYINSPFSNAMYMMGAGQSAKAAQNIGGTNMSALSQMMKGSGMTGQAGAGWLAAQKAQTGRANQSMLGQSQTSNVLSALQRQMQATGMGLSFTPQLTGQTGNFQQTQQSSGLGTWLPQLMGAGLNAGMAAMTGGMSSAAGGGGGFGSLMGGGGGSGAGFSGFSGSSPFTGFTPSSGLSGMVPTNPFNASMFSSPN